MSESGTNGSNGNGAGRHGRDGMGRFTDGNQFGRGRPGVKIERQYLEALTSVVSLEDWRDIVRRAVRDARAGKAKAREWLARYCLGKNPPSLKDVAVKEAAGLTAQVEVDREAGDRRAIESRVAQYCRMLGIDERPPAQA
jgi:hypothetical protein